ncbi:hypothetical protein [Neorhodopirellula pilleata]|uniref:Uncharacterized protein n=1 Tax=Neorhodopirellula pilleata TaxID=2714738 RepID=A0A5C5ZMD0_9BACT|nr:hypothetical protein [Neorhodopirellula pilleata]TWT88011.1 hypothetical protein Pla100_57410 [Neorhodopirellula pilleata]
MTEKKSIDKAAWLRLYDTAHALATTPASQAKGIPDAIQDRLHELLDACEDIFRDTGIPTEADRVKS